ncbi:hypothetical protein [Streptomyces sp. NPDC047999]|uniref:hypothetical protein n=1 Tax=Streptomyces sp. NPDC047999 TaxID=3365497 RepID=UPI00371AF204
MRGRPAGGPARDGLDGERTEPLTPRLQRDQQHRAPPVPGDRAPPAADHRPHLGLRHLGAVLRVASGPR